MQSLKYIHWKDGDFYIGHFVNYPDYLTQGESMKELIENLKDLYRDIKSNEVPYIRKIDELVITS